MNTRTPACQGHPNPDIWFSETRDPKKDKADHAAAKKICVACTVRAECLTLTLDWEGDIGPKYRHGILGGLTGKERDRLVHLEGNPTRARDVTPAHCGTPAGARRHRRMGEPVDTECRAALNRERATLKTARHDRAHQVGAA